MSSGALPKPPCATSHRPWRVSPTAAGWSPSPGATPVPINPTGAKAFMRPQEKARVVFTAAIAGQAYARHGTTIETRLTVIDRVPAEDPRAFPPSPGMAADTAELLGWISHLVPAP